MSPNDSTVLNSAAAPSERPKPTPSAGADFERFREFYAEYQSGQQANAGGGYWAVTGPIKYKGQDQVQRDIANLKEGLRNYPNVKGFLPVVAPASVLAGRPRRILRHRGETECGARGGFAQRIQSRSPTPA